MKYLFQPMNYNPLLPCVATPKQGMNFIVQRFSFALRSYSKARVSNILTDFF
jgi:hypothetical protein